MIGRTLLFARKADRDQPSAWEVGGGGKSFTAEEVRGSYPTAGIALI